MMTIARNILVGLSALLALGLVTLGGALGVDWAQDLYAARQINGTLTWNPAEIPPAVYPVGEFLVTWDAEQTPAGEVGRLLVAHASAPSRILWATLPGRSFVSAARGTEVVDESRGSFFIEDSLGSVFADQSVDRVELSTDSSSLELSGQLGRPGPGGDLPRYTLTFEAAGPRQLRFDLAITSDGLGVNRAYLTYASDAGERFFGFGEQFTHFDLKGRRLPIFIMEQGIGRGAQPITLGANLTARAGGAWHTTYAGVPHYITSRLNSLFLENSEYTVFDLRREDRVHIQVFAREVAGRILYGDSPADLIAEYTGYAGRMRPLPDWILEGAVVGMQGGTERVREVAAELAARGTPVAAFWLQDWVGQRVTSFGKQLWWNWELDQTRYPGWAGLVDDLKAQGIRVMTYISPFLTDVAEKPGHGRNLFREAAELGFLVKTPQGQPYLIQNTDFAAGLIDLTNPAAREWVKDIMRRELAGVGASGWMADFGEALPYDAVLWSGEPAPAVHNRYPELWAEVNREAVEELEAEDDGTGDAGDAYVFFMRSGFTRSPGCATLFWEGDQLVSWDRYDGIKSAVTGLLSSGLSGFAFNHSDIGGYTAVTNPVRDYHRSKELLLRWMDLSAFTTIFRTHEGNRPDDNVQFYTDQETLAHFDRMARVYQAWEFYRRELVAEAAATGLPVVRPLFIHYPADPNVYAIDYQQFLVGSEFLVAPVLDPGRNEVQVYLPTGHWVHLWSGRLYGGPGPGTAVTVPAPLGEPAVFYRVTFGDGPGPGDEFRANLERAGLIQPQAPPEALPPA